MNLVIRSERQTDYNAISETILMAFRKPERNYVEEVTLVDTLRHRKDYQRDLALVAEIEGEIVGYAFFSPYDLYFRNNLVKAVFLAPIGVHPKFQKQSIGKRLLEEGHRRAKEKGYGLALLYGDNNYYSRVGYKANMFSERGIVINKADLPKTTSNIVERPVETRDIKEIVSMWHEWHKQEPIAMFPGNNLIDWISHNHKYVASSMTINDQLVGYIRYGLKNPASLMSFISNNRENTTNLLSYLRNKISSLEGQSLHLPVNPFSKIVRELIPSNFSSAVNMSKYAMLKILDEGNVFVQDYVSFIEDSKKNIGVLNLPAQLEWC